MRLASIFKNSFRSLPVFCYSHRILYLWLLVFSILSIFDITEADQFRMSAVYKISFTIFVAAFKTIFILYILQFLFRGKLLKIAAYFLIFFYGLLSITNFLSYHLYGFGITRKFILIIAQSTSREISGFVPQLFSNIAAITKSLYFPIFAAAILIATIMIRYIRIRAFSTITLVSAIIGAGIYLVFAFGHTSGRTAISLSARLAKYTREVYIWDKTFKESLRDRKELPYSESIRSDHLAKTVIVVIGESASRRHLSCYGYPLPTTPGFDAAKDNLYIYSDAIGSSSSTSGNMERILSFKTDDRTCNDGLDYPLLIDVFEKANYKTYWISNQERTGNVSNTSGVMTFGASVIKYTGADNSEDALTVRYDEIVLKELQAAMKDSSDYKLIFLHILGSHTKYLDRYPKSFDKFTAKDELKYFGSSLPQEYAATRAEYDNSIRYTDYILSNILRAVDKEQDAAMLIYFSDHGENVYDEGNYCGRGERFVEVPFIIYPNQAYRNKNHEIINLLEKSLDRKFSTANFVHQLLTLTGTTYRCYDASRDVMSENFRQRKRFVDEKIWKYEE